MKFAGQIAKEVATERGIAFVDDPSSPRINSQIPAGGNKCDITSEVQARMNAKTSSADPVK
jgi:hypothetical protein